MILSNLLGAEVRLEDHKVGHVIDVRLLADEVTTDQPMPRMHVYGFVVSPHARSSNLGYERSGVRSPWPIAAFEHWRHRDSFLVRWGDVQAVRERWVELRPGATRYRPDLVVSARRGPDFGDREH
jgi:hypothetical protein